MTRAHIVDWFVPADAPGDEERRERLRVFVRALLGIAAILCLLGVLFIAVRGTPSGAERALLALALAVPLAGALLLRISGRELHVLFVVFALGLAVITLWARVTGGILSPVLPWFLAALAMMAVFGNRLLLWIGSAMVVGALVFLYLLTIRGYVPPSLVPPAMMQEIWLFSAVSAGGVVTLTAAYVMSERAASRARLRAARDTAVRANRAKSTFLSSMSHELRTPLSTVVGFAEVLKLDQKEPLTPAQAGHVERILDAADHLVGLVNQVIDMSRIAAGDVELEIADVRVPDVVRSAVAMVELSAAQRGIAIECRPPEGGGLVVRADATRLRQVLLHLLKNAIQYNRDNGSVSVEASPAGSNVRIAVRDTGNGIPAARREELFESFARLGRESGPVQGSGLGLSMSRQLVELMRGRIGFDSQEGVGSTFWIELPGAD